MITIKLYANLREIAGQGCIEVPFEYGGTVRDLVEAIRKTYPKLADRLVGPDGRLTGLANVMVDGRNVVWLQDLDTVIQPGAQVDLIPPAAGG